MKNVLLLALLATVTVGTSQQLGRKASLNELGQIVVTEVAIPETLPARQGGAVTELFSFGRPANPIIKNSRGVTLADIDGDGIEEILYGIDTKLYALEGNGDILWEKDVLGPVLLPPSVADLDDDGTPEIIVNTGYPTTVGRIYVVEGASGNDLPGWPLNFNDNWMINAPAIADVDLDGTLDIITCERAGSAEGYVHALNIDGTEINANWPVLLDATPAFTPSIGDIDNDGGNDVVIATSSTGMYAYDANGTLLTGFPLVDPNVKYSYQSPILVDLDDDSTLEIVGTNHGDAPGFYVLNHDATYYPGWPVATAGWTYSAPTVVDLEEDGSYELFMADRNTSGDGSPLPTIYGLTPDGNDLSNFPISKYGGNEGVLTIADITNDGVMEVIFSSTLTDMDGNGYLHAYSVDGSGEVPGFPLRSRGFTFLNGAVVGDVDDDGMMDITFNSYTQTFGAGIDSTFVNVYDLNVPYSPDAVLSNGYKGNNRRYGLVGEELFDVNEVVWNAEFALSPNPSEGRLALQCNACTETVSVQMVNVEGRLIFSEEVAFQSNPGFEKNLSELSSGIYFVTVSNGTQSKTLKWIKR
ncbi:T9SS type A sorting domain-containing protein [Altibacter sp. HG106]|uniref:T9SS type A sorting domain-containing protein n=1 Tax=Altibacter sp. HG106 TaxID=3023937 RepID=UPI002350C5A6|nr:T9SS type A sorting domain-containing protein [Altibacter sp. HG106]MDC7996081.1 T9SS type A sorting domain-containing protein [Altibacter sp. HG106]